MSLTLYNTPGSPFGQRAVIALRETGVDWKEEVIDLSNKPEWFVKDINPEGKVPTLKLANGAVLTESAVIAEYIVKEYGKDASLLPNDPLSQAQAILFGEHWNQTVKTIFDFLKSLQTDDKADIQAKKDILNARIRRADELLSAKSPEGPFMEGDRFTLADILAAPIAVRLHSVEIIAGETFGGDLPRFQKWIAALKTLPSVRETTPSDEKLIETFERVLKFKYT